MRLNADASVQCLSEGSPSSEPSSASSDGIISSPGIACFSLIQAPRSINLHRSLQNGRQAEASVHSTGFSHVGQATVFAGTSSFLQWQTNKVKGTSSVHCTGCVLASNQVRNRTLQRWCPPLISGKFGEPGGKAIRII